MEHSATFSPPNLPANIYHYQFGELSDIRIRRKNISLLSIDICAKYAITFIVYNKTKSNYIKTTTALYYNGYLNVGISE